MDSSLTWACASCRHEVQCCGNISCDSVSDCDHLRAVSAWRFKFLSLPFPAAGQGSQKERWVAKGRLWAGRYQFWWASWLLLIAAIACALQCDGGVLSTAHVRDEAISGVSSLLTTFVLLISNTGHGCLIPAFTANNANEMRMQLGQHVQPQLPLTHTPCQLW